MYLGRFSRYLYVQRFSRPDYLEVKKKIMSLIFYTYLLLCISAYIYL